MDKTIPFLIAAYTTIHLHTNKASFDLHHTYIRTEDSNNGLPRIADAVQTSVDILGAMMREAGARGVAGDDVALELKQQVCVCVGEYVYVWPNLSCSSYPIPSHYIHTNIYTNNSTQLYPYPPPAHTHTYTPTHTYTHTDRCPAAASVHRYRGSHHGGRGERCIGCYVPHQ